MFSSSRLASPFILKVDDSVRMDGGRGSSWAFRRHLQAALYEGSDRSGMIPKLGPAIIRERVIREPIPLPSHWNESTDGTDLGSKDAISRAADRYEDWIINRLIRGGRTIPLPGEEESSDSGSDSDSTDDGRPAGAAGSGKKRPIAKVGDGKSNHPKSVSACDLYRAVAAKGRSHHCHGCNEAAETDAQSPLLRSANSAKRPERPHLPPFLPLRSVEKPQTAHQSPRYRRAVLRQSFQRSLEPFVSSPLTLPNDS